MAQGKSLQIDRVTMELYGPGTAVRRHTENFLIQTEKTMRDFPVLLVKLQEYGLGPFAGRRIEKLHADVKRTGSHAYGILLPQLCSATREPQNLKLLQSDPDFHAFCMKHWHSRTLLDGLLTLRMSREELKMMTSKQKVNTIYQCSLACEYTNSTESKIAHASFLAITADERPKPPKPTVDETLAIDGGSESTASDSPPSTIPVRPVEADKSESEEDSSSARSSSSERGPASLDRVRP